MIKEKILVVDGEHNINKLVCSYLAKENYLPLSAYNSEEAMKLLKRESPSLIILETILPDAEGPVLSLEIRKHTEAPIVFLSCKAQEMDKIIALSAGGDDYITKPFMPGELIARVKAHLRRQKMLMKSISLQTDNIYNFGSLKIDFDTHECFCHDKMVSLTSKEFDILRLLIENPRKVFPAAQIYENVWKTTCLESDIKTVMVYISTLRKKLQKNPSDHEFIINIRGVGYKFNETS